MTTTEIDIEELRRRANDYHRKAIEADSRAAVFGKRCMRYVKKCGDVLREMKEYIGHSNWTSWLEANFDSTPQTARGYMRISEHWNTVGPKVKSGNVLSIRAALRLCRRTASEAGDPPESYISRLRLLDQLKCVSPGLTSRGLTERYESLLFRKGRVYTFNDEIGCSGECDLKIEGAVSGEMLLSFLNALDDDFIQAKLSDDGLYLEIKGERRKGHLPVIECELMPEEVQPRKVWKSLPEEFCESVRQTIRCASTDHSRFALTCVHITPGYVETCNNYEGMRCTVMTPIKRPVLIRSKYIALILRFGLVAITRKGNWLHFRSADGFEYTLRIHVDEYPNYDSVFECDGNPIVFPNALVKAAKIAHNFSSRSVGANRIFLRGKPGELRILGDGEAGRFEEVLVLSGYDGPPFDVGIHPTLARDDQQRRRL